MAANLEIPKGFRVTAFVAHPDDETLGCGGLLARFAREGANCRAVLAFHRTDSRLGDAWPLLLKSFEQACGVLDCEPVVRTGLPESGPGLDIQTLHDAVVDEVDACDLAMTHWYGDTHQAHRALAHALEIATRPFRRRRHLWYFETPSSSDQSVQGAFSPNYCVELSRRDVELQQHAFSLYPSGEHAPGRDVDRILAQAEYRGRQFGTEYACGVMAARGFL